jgi:cytochrome P450
MQHINGKDSPEIASLNNPSAPEPRALSDPDTYQQGHPLEDYARAQNGCPIAWQRDAEGYFAVTGHPEIRNISSDPSQFCSAFGFKLKNDSYSRLGDDIDAAMRHVILATDPPLHNHLRDVLNRFFGPQAMRDREPSIRRLVSEVLDELPLGRPIDIVRSATAPLPIRVLCDLMEVPVDDRERVYHWTNRLTGADDPEYNSSPAAAAAVFREVFEYGRELFRIRRISPGKDILSAFGNVEINGHLLDERFTDGFFVLMVAAGNETTRNAITGLLYLLAKHPEQRDQLLSDPALIRNAVEEALRIVSPVIHMRRTAVESATVDNASVAAGDRLALFYGAANHDARVFSDPSRFDIHRANARMHLAFGTGPHNCVGAPLARLEIRVFIEEFLRRFPRYELSGDPCWLRSDFVAGIKSLQITLKH